MPTRKAAGTYGCSGVANMLLGGLPPGWHGDGIIARVADRGMGRYLAEASAPVVNVSAAHIPGVDFPTVSIDLRAVARQATDHLLDHGFRHFGYYAPQGFSYAKTYYESFVERLAEVGLNCCLFLGRRGTGTTSTWQRRQEELQRWLRDQPKPVAILTWTSDLAREVSYACQAMGLLVPEQVAVMAGGDDSVLCETCTPAPFGGGDQFGADRLRGCCAARQLASGQALPKQTDPNRANPRRRSPVDGHAGSRRQGFGSSDCLYPRQRGGANPG